MLESFIKEWLLQKKSRVYSIIVDTYPDELKSLKPALFRSWLAKEIDVPEEKINLNSLASALSRLRKKEQNTSLNKNAKSISKETVFKNEDFQFSTLDSNDTRASRIKDM